MTSMEPPRGAATDQLAEILLVGDVMLDRYYQGRCDRISPEAPVPVLHVRNSFERPGGAANVAVNVAAMGCRPRLVGAIGTDYQVDLQACTQHRDCVRVCDAAGARGPRWCFMSPSRPNCCPTGSNWRLRRRASSPPPPPRCGRTARRRRCPPLMW